MAKSRSIGGIYASLSLKDKGFQAGVKSAKRALVDFGKKAAIGAGVGVAAGSAALVAGSRRTLSMADDLGDLSAQTGVAIDDMMELQQAYSMGGRAADMAGKDIGKMQKSIVEAASGGKNPFKDLGMDAKQLLELNPGEQFKKIGAAIMGMSNPAERTAKAMEIFGKGGMGLTTVFEGIPDAVTSLGEMPEIAKEFADRMGEANDLIGNLPLKSDQFFMGFTAGIVDMILPGLNDINEFDFTPLGKSLGDSLSDGIDNASVLLNTIWDVVTFQDSKGVGGGNKYEEARLALELEDQLAVAMKKVDKFHEEKNKKLMEFNPEDFAMPEVKAADFDSMIAKNIESGMFEKEPIELNRPDVNSYQSMGLSLGGDTLTRKQDTTNTLLKDIKTVLQDANRAGTLKF